MAALSICAAWIAFARALPNVAPVLDYHPALQSLVVDRDGRTIGRFYSEQRSLVALAQLPRHLVLAFLAAEDRDFYAHGGIDLSALVRAAVANFRGGRVVEGGSTITQQLAKTVLLTPERTIWRKLREAALSLRIERELTKDEILETYLNEVYLGAGAYGVAAAAQVYFGKAPEALTLSEAAMLAGLPKAPSVLSPIVNPELAEQRRRLVLARMMDAGFVSDPELQAALAERPAISPQEPSEIELASAYVVEQIRRALVDRLGGETVLAGGLRIETSLDSELQLRATRSLRAGVEAAHRRIAPRDKRDGSPGVQGALVSVEVDSGDVLAWVGGYDFASSRYDRACQARRQPGSAFKTFVYGAALERGFTADSLVYDVQYEARDRSSGRYWRPRNHGSGLRGPVPMFEAFARSLNNATIRLADDVGIAPVVDFARRAGIRSALAEDLGLALGTSGVTLLEITNAYSTLARGGRSSSPRVVRRVLDRDGRVLLTDVTLCGMEAEPAAERISPVDAFLVTHLLREAVRAWYGTGHLAARLGPTIAGKTGSTNENRDAWFVGFSPAVTTGVWVGRDDNAPMGRTETGSRAALPIWVDFMDAANAKYPAAPPPVPAGVMFAGRDSLTGERVRTARAISGWVPVAENRRARYATYVAPPPTEPPPQAPSQLGLGADGEPLAANVASSAP